MNPLISIIVPVYNAEKTINRCVDSILAQTYTHFELLLINDGSKDKSGEICDKYAEKDNRIKVFHQENGGVSSARNKGIDNAIGEYITFIDSDDYIDNTYLEDFEINSEPNFDLIAQGLRYIGKDGVYTSSKGYQNTHTCNLTDFYSESVINCIIYGPCTKLYRLEIIQNNNIKFNTSISYGEDNIYVANYTYYCNIFKVINKCGYNYTHENSNSLTRSKCDAKQIYEFVLQHYYTTRKIHTKVELDDYIKYWELIHTIHHLYNSIYLAFTDTSLTNWELYKFIKDLDTRLLHTSYKYDLPRTYRIIRFAYRILPVSLFVPFMKFALKFR